MKIAREVFESEGMRVESFFGTEVLVMHEGCGELSVIVEMRHGGERYYVACLDASVGCYMEFVRVFARLFGSPLRAVFNDRHGNSVSEVFFN